MPEIRTCHAEMPLEQGSGRLCPLGTIYRARLTTGTLRFQASFGALTHVLRDALMVLKAFKLSANCRAVDRFGERPVVCSLVTLFSRPAGFGSFPLLVVTKADFGDCRLTTAKLLLMLPSFNLER